MKRLKFITIGFFIISIFITIALLTYNSFEPKAYDFMTKKVVTKKLPFDNLKNIYGNQNTVLIVIDEKTVTKYRWPWKRELNCKIFEFLSYSKPKLIIYDAIIATLDSDNPNSDKKFFHSIENFDNLITGFMPRINSWIDKETGEAYDKKFGEKFAINVTDNSKQVPDLYESMMTFPEPYFNAVKHTGSVSMLPGFIHANLSPQSADEIYRNHGYIHKYQGKFYPSLAMEAFLTLNNNPEVYINNKYITVKNENLKIKYNKTKFKKLRYYQTSTPLKFYNLYDNGYSHKKYSALDIMDSFDAIKQGKKPKINPEDFENKIVLIGANVPTGTGMNDIKNTPMLTNHPGVDIQATAIDNIIHNDFLKVLPHWVNILITLLGMLLVYNSIKKLSIYKSTLSIFTIIILYLILCTICYYNSVVISVLTPVVMFIMTTIIAFTHKFIIEKRNKEKVKSAMGKFMSEDVMEKVLINIDNLGLGGKKAIVTVLFADIRGFTSMSEQMTAQEVSELLNEYFTEMEPIITKHNGIINKFIGDAIMAIYGEPIIDEEHAKNAVMSACEMLDKVKSLQSKWEKEGKPKINIGIGINTGEVFIGNIGSINRMEYTVIGDTVNLASRLESYNKQFNSNLLISSSTYEKVKDYVDANKISNVEIRGKANKMDIYEITKFNY